MTSPSSSGPLAGVTVVALEQYIAGPYCTSLLADAGATVIKVERPGAGDPRRTYEPSRGSGTEVVSSGFVSYNRGKRSVTLDLDDRGDHEVLVELLHRADVFVSNLRPGALAARGLDSEALRCRHPRLLVCEISGFGSTGGPFGSWPAFDSVIQAMSGLSSLIGPAPDAPPGLAPMGTMDLLAGAYAALGIVMSLVHRSRTGAGEAIDISMYDVGAAFLERPLTLHEFTGVVPTRGRDDFSPVATFRCGDSGWVALVIPTDEMWRRCCAAIDAPQLEHDPRLDTVLKRSAAMAELVVPELERWATTRTRDEAVALLRAAGQPAGVVQGIDEVRRCPQLAHRDLFVEVADPSTDVEGVPMRFARLPIRFGSGAVRPRRIPRLGEHDDEILGPVRADLAQRRGAAS